MKTQIKANEEQYAFTFGVGQEHCGKYVVIHGNFIDSRQKMYERFGSKWSMQYRYDENFIDIAARWNWEELQ